MKQGWEIRRLEEICLRITDGSHFSPKEDLNGKYPMLSVKDMGLTCFSYDNCKYINEDDYKTLVANGCKPSIDDVLVAKDGSYLKTAFVQRVEKEQVILSSIAILTPNKTILNPDFLAFFFKSHHTKDIVERNYLTGTAIKRVILKGFRKISLSVPPIAEQEKIVAELDCLSGIIVKKKQQLKELDNLAQSIFYEMFGDPVENDKGWETINIENICSSIVRGPFGSALKKEFFVEQAPTTYKVYEQKHAIQKSADIGTYFIDAERFQTLKRFEVVPGDIIMSCSGTIGEFFVIPEGAERGIINQALLKYTLNDSIDQTYFLYVMEWVKENFDKKGTGLQNIGSVGTIKKTKISFPPLPLQQDFASKIESIEKQKELIAQSIKETETLFNSRMDYYFG